MWKTKVVAGSKEEFLKKAAEIAPQETVLHFRPFYRTPRGNTGTHQRHTCPVRWPVNVNSNRSWWSGCRPIWDRPTKDPKSLILWGPTLIGKTLWARSLGTHAYFPGLFMLEGFNATESQYAIFDGMEKGLKSIQTSTPKLFFRLVMAVVWDNVVQWAVSSFAGFPPQLAERRERVLALFKIGVAVCLIFTTLIWTWKLENIRGV